MNAHKPRRVFFALWPDATLRQHLAALQHNPALPPGKQVPASNLHISLHFIGNTTEVDCLLEQAQQLQGEAFTFSLDRLGWFKRAGVAWAGCSAIPPAMGRLAAACAALSRECDAVGEVFPVYAPHCTLRRKVRQAPSSEMLEPLVWQASAFHLLESRPLPTGGVYYHSIGEFPLAPLAP